ncbi:4a-hydroxytetrahydrobiopterin dehydratase [Candidatus Woesearchaeota archaeon]|nr:4a-hydroxytetrahydrobiopterin dehydratase [Candidatus Woesearchaeota archaeon]
MEGHLSIKEVHDRLQELNGWEMSDYSSIYKDFEFKDFKEAMEFAQKIGENAVHEYHYPQITIRKNIVRLALTTPEEGGLTYKDFKLAKIIEQLI